MSATSAKRPPLAVLLTNTEDVHATPVERELNLLGTPYLRYDTDVAWPTSGASFHLDRNGSARATFTGSGITAESSEITAVWNRRPTRAAVAPQLDGNPRDFAIDETTAGLQGTLRSIDSAWLSHPDAVRAASFRPAQLRAAVAAGFTVPETLVSQDPALVYDFMRAIGGRAIAKLVSSGPPRLPSNDPYNVFAGIVETRDLDDSQISLSPVLYQRPVPKAYELRVTLVGDNLLACAMDSQTSMDGLDDWRRADPESIAHRPVTLDDPTATRCRRLARALGLEFGAFDLVVTPEGETVFLEVNPNGQWLWIEDFTGLPIAAAIARWLTDGTETSRPVTKVNASVLSEGTPR
ncbi:hypothetical protein IMCC26256_111829 [Actinobacteria bacterium IMCC26256]|nr:hypothetical protein IMCC26256_111829 [Actinobacteria bacterium IMCC26256]